MKTGLLAGISLVCVLIVSVILNGINQFKLGSQLASVNQISNLSHLFVRQQANILSLMLLKNTKNDELTDALDNFAKEDFVVDANLYAPNGTLVAQSRSSRELKLQLAERNSKNMQQIVEPITSEQDLVGFLRVTIDAEYGQTTKNKVEQLFHQLYGELIILFLAGAVLASSYHYFFRRKHNHTHTPSKLVTVKAKTQTQRFHSRRRVFSRR